MNFVEDEIKSQSEDELRAEYDFRKMRIVARGIGRSAMQANVDRQGKTLMGEVRVRVKLTNAGDEILVRRAINTGQDSQLRS